MLLHPSKYVIVPLYLDSIHPLIMSILLVANTSEYLWHVLPIATGWSSTSNEVLYFGSVTWTRGRDGRVLWEGIIYEVASVPLAQLMVHKVLGLLDKLSGTVSPSFFFQNIWLIMLTSPSARGTSLSLLSRRLPHMNPDEGVLPSLWVIVLIHLPPNAIENFYFDTKT